MLSNVSCNFASDSLPLKNQVQMRKPANN